MTQSKSILELKRKALAMGLCGDYKGMWDNSTTQRDLVDMATDINGADFLCASVAKGWGLTKDFLLSNFNGLINGDYVAKCGKDNGYTSEIYIGHSGDITARTTILIVLYSDATIHVPINHVCRIFLAGNGEIHIVANGHCEIVDYDPGHNSTFMLNGNTGHVSFTDPYKDPDSWINFSSKDEEEQE